MGISVVLVVVFFIGLLQNILLRSPLIFMRLAETQAGELNILVTPATITFDDLLDIGIRADEDTRLFAIQCTRN